MDFASPCLKLATMENFNISTSFSQKDEKTIMGKNRPYFVMALFLHSLINFSSFMPITKIEMV
jgi:hypothetical protein